jgi:hypothetical protein
MDTTITTGWWGCAGCGVDAELPVAATAGCEVPCPDCGDPMTENWRWESVAAA